MNLFKYNKDNAKFNRDIIITKQIETKDFYRIYSCVIYHNCTMTINWGLFCKDYVEDVTNLIVSMYNYITELKRPLLFRDYTTTYRYFEKYLEDITGLSIDSRKRSKYKKNIEELFDNIAFFHEEVI